MNTKNGNLEKLLNDLNTVCYDLHTKYFINFGGCCYVAYIIAKRLEKLHIRYKFVISDYEFYGDIPSSLKCRKSIKSRDNNFTYMDTRCHYYLEINNKYINPMYNHGRYDSVSIGWINSDDILYLYKKGSWNNSFKHKYIPNIEKSINLVFNNYEKENS